jgi:hypothetical protein
MNKLSLIVALKATLANGEPKKGFIIPSSGMVNMKMLDVLVVVAFCGSMWAVVNFLVYTLKG